MKHLEAEFLERADILVEGAADNLEEAFCPDTCAGAQADQILFLNDGSPP